MVVSKRSTARRVTFTFHYIIYAPASCRTAAKAPFACWLSCSLIRRLLLLHLNGICRWTSQLLLRGSFSKRSTGRRVNGSNGSNGSTAHFHFHYIIYDSRRRQAHATLLQKAHGVNGSTGQQLKRVDGSTAQFHFHYIIYDSRRCQAHATRCKKHTVSFARSTGKFPSHTIIRAAFVCLFVCLFPVSSEVL